MRWLSRVATFVLGIGSLDCGGDRPGGLSYEVSGNGIGIVLEF